MLKTFDQKCITLDFNGDGEGRIMEDRSLCFQDSMGFVNKALTSSFYTDS